MRIAFVWPPAFSRLETMPLAFGLLFHAIRHMGHEVRLFNCSLEGWTYDDPRLLEAIRSFRPDVVGTSAWPLTATSACRTIDAVRTAAPDATYICGGNYATMCPDALLQHTHFDWVFRGEAEATFPRFLELLAAGDHEGIDQLPGIYRKRPDGTVVDNNREYEVDLDKVGEIDYDFIEMERYFRSGYMKTLIGKRRKAPIFITRGCPYRCSFCTVPQVAGRKLRHWSVDFLMRQVRKLYWEYDVRHLNFMDDNPTHDMSFFKDFCRAVIEEDLPGLVLENHRGTRIERLDAEMLGLMKQAGFEHVVIAPETGADNARDRLKKDMSTDTVRNAVRMIREAGLGLHGFFMMGAPGETPVDRQATWDLIDELDFDYFKIHKFIPLPGTPLFEKLVEEGFIEYTFTPEGYLVGAGSREFVESQHGLDAEAAWQYARFYARHPSRFIHVVKSAPVEAWTMAAVGLVGSVLRPAPKATRVVPNPV